MPEQTPEDVLKRATALLARCRVEAFTECTLAEAIEEIIRDLIRVVERHTQVHIGGDGTPETSCLLCGHRRSLAIWQWVSAEKAVGVCDPCRAQATVEAQPLPARERADGRQ